MVRGEGGLQRRTLHSTEGNCSSSGLLWEEGGYDFFFSLFFPPKFVFTLFPEELPIKRLSKFEMRLLLFKFETRQSFPPALV